MQISAPIQATSYVRDGFTLPASRHSLLLPLIACGFILASGRAFVLLASLGVLVLALWLAFRNLDPFLMSEGGLVSFVLRYTVLTASLGLTTGGMLLLPHQARQWLGPAAGACCGLGIGFSLGLESPGDSASDWFLAASGLGSVAVIIGSIALANAIKDLGNYHSLLITSRILGSWLVAANMMLLVIALAPQHSVQLPPLPASDTAVSPVPQ